MISFYWFSIYCMWAACALNILMAWRSERRTRWNHHIREVLWAYEKELRERGVSLPPRCVECCQILPKHVDGCEFGNFYRMVDGQSKVHEWITRPPIKWYPKGGKPPDFGGKA